MIAGICCIAHGGFRTAWRVLVFFGSLPMAVSTLSLQLRQTRSAHQTHDHRWGVPSSLLMPF